MCRVVGATAVKSRLCKQKNWHASSNPCNLAPCRRTHPFYALYVDIVVLYYLFFTVSSPILFFCISLKRLCPFIFHGLTHVNSSSPILQRRAFWVAMEAKYRLLNPHRRMASHERWTKCTDWRRFKNVTGLASYSVLPRLVFSVQITFVDPENKSITVEGRCGETVLDCAMRYKVGLRDICTGKMPVAAGDYDAGLGCFECHIQVFFRW